MGLLLSVHLLSAITISKFPYNTILQYLQYSDHNNENNIDYKKYLHTGPCTQYGKMSHKENLHKSQNHF